MDLVGYLEALPRVAISRLYTSPWTCQAVLRGLPPIAKLYVLRMVPIEVNSAHELQPMSLRVSWMHDTNLAQTRRS